jgi:signal transduction histidine kinase
LTNTIRALESGQVDFMSLAYSDMRASKFVWLERTWTLNQALVFRAGRRFYPRVLDDLAGEIVAVEEGSLMHELLRDLPEVRRPLLLITPNQPAALRLIVNGGATAAVGNWLTLQYEARKLGERDLVFHTTRSLSYHLATRHGNEANVTWVAPALRAVRESGVFDRLVERHLVIAPVTHNFWDYASYAAMLLCGTAAVALGFVLWNRSLHKQIRARQTAVDRTTRLQTITAALAEAVTPAEVATVAVEQGGASLRAQAGMMALLSADETQLEITRSTGYAADSLEPWKTMPVTAGLAIAEAARRRVPVLLDDPETARTGSLHPVAGVTRAVIAVPLLAGGRALGGLAFAFTQSRRFDGEDHAMVLAIARQSALAFERARLYEAERVARAEAEAASHAKDEFLATLSHELRTPLNAILGWSHMLRTGVLDEQKASRALETIERNARVQMQLIGDLLDVSRAVMGNLQLEMQRVNIVSPIEAALEAVRPAAHGKGVSLCTQLPRTQVVLDADPARLQQIFWNLLSNAIKFTPVGGRVDVEVSSRSTSAVVSVRDTGVGIAPEGLPYVFDRFYQGDASTTRTHGGLGLGLAIVRHLVDLHGGFVTAESAGPDRGCVFTVTLPLNARVTTRERAAAGAT